MKTRETELRAEVDRWLEAAEAADAQEDKLHGASRRGDEMPGWVADKQKRLAEGGRAQRQFGSTHLARPWSATAPDAHSSRKLSNDRAASSTNYANVVGLHVDPPAHTPSCVLSVDEKKAEIQALDRTQPGLPAEEGSRRDNDASL